MRRLLLICLTSLGAASVVLAQVLAEPTSMAVSNAPAIPSKAPVATSSSPAAPTALKPVASSQPFWKDLSASEQAALRPLGANWDSMGLGQKRKWLSVARDFEKLPASQQIKLHTRMTEWAALSPKQRADARQNFALNRELTDGLTPEQRKAQWQAYQQLSPEEKRKLAESAPKVNATGAAPASKPQPVLKKDPAPDFGTAKVLAKAKAAPTAPAPGKKISVAQHVTDHGHILPGHTAESTDKP